MKAISNQSGVIIWHTGTPDKAGDYIVTGKTDEGDVFIMEDSFMSNNEWWACYSAEVLAWCPISNIKPYKEDEKMKASDCKCCECGQQAVAFWPVIDLDIPSHPYCRKCLDKAKLEMMVKLSEMFKKK